MSQHGWITSVPPVEPERNAVQKCKHQPPSFGFTLTLLELTAGVAGLSHWGPLAQQVENKSEFLDTL